MTSRTSWDDRLLELDRSAWLLAAVVAGLRDGEPSALAVLQELGLPAELGPEEVGNFVTRATGALLQSGKVVSGGSAWDDQDDEALLAQGRASAATGKIFGQRILPQLPGAERLLTGPARFLDVGVGVGALAVALCRELPHLSVVGLDVLDRPLRLARREVDDAGLGERIELRQQDVADFESAEAFDLAWLPAPFIPPSSLHRGVGRVVSALRPNGWLLLGHGRLAGDPLEAAVTRFKTMVYGGTALDDEEAEGLLSDCGLVNVHHLQTPPGAPSLAVARKA